MNLPRFNLNPELTNNDFIAAKLALSKIDDYAARAAREVCQRKEEWIKAVSARVLPGFIYRAIQKHGLKVPQCAVNWMKRHVALREGPKGQLQYVLDGKIVAETVIQPPRIWN